MNFTESALAFPCQGEQLYGILSLPEQAGPRGVLVVVGGPQYRAGSHRQFTLLARQLAARGIPVMRFDYRGMGDAEGTQRDFEQVDADLRTAIDQFFARTAGLREVVLWGLCDAASACLMYAHNDERVRGIVILNPWVRSNASLATATLKHYYRARLFDPALWKKIASGQFKPGAALRSFAGTVKSALRPRKASQPAQASLPFQQRMLLGLQAFEGPVLLVISTPDLTGQEFVGLVESTPAWQAALRKTTRHTHETADHTFSRRAWRDQVGDWTCEWMATW